MNHRIVAAVLAIVTTAACRRAEPKESAPAIAPTPAASEPHLALDRLDGRTAVPLLPMMANHQKQNMRDHLLVVQEIVLAIASDDFAAVERAAGRIGYSDQTGAMCAHMGAGAPGFTDLSMRFHHAADGITAAARQHDRAGVIDALGTTLQSCTGCHAVYRQDVVDEPTWNRLTTMPAPTGHSPGT